MQSEHAMYCGKVVLLLMLKLVCSQTYTEKLLNIQCDKMQCVSDDESYVYRRVKLVAEKKFHLVTVKTNWYKAQQFCAVNGMRFATISCKNDNAELMEQLRRLATPVDFIWISANKLGEDDQNFYWAASGKEISFSDWDLTELKSKPCVTLKRDKYGSKGGYKWVTDSCDQLHAFLCEYYT